MNEAVRALYVQRWEKIKWKYSSKTGPIVPIRWQGTKVKPFDPESIDPPFFNHFQEPGHCDECEGNFFQYKLEYVYPENPKLFIHNFPCTKSLNNWLKVFGPYVQITSLPQVGE